MARTLKVNGFLLLLLFVGLNATAQGSLYRWQTPLQDVQGAGYYKLLLSPDVRALAASNGDDFRIVDSSGNYVPYLVRSETAATQADDVTVLPVMFNSDTQSETIVIENSRALQLSELVLTMHNKAQGTDAQLTGSDDGQKWFDISNDIFLYPSSGIGTDTFDQQISFPTVKYKKIRLSVKAHKSIPLNIIKVVLVKPVITNGQYSAIPSPVIIQRDSGKVSYVTLDFKETYFIDQLYLSISGPRLYHRNADIFARDTGTWTTVGSGILNSTRRSELNIRNKARHLLIVINNEDNKPLKVEAVNGLQLNNYLIGYFEEDKNYFLVFGNSKAERPSYDITYFEDSIKNCELKEITCGAIGPNKIIPNTEPSKKAVVKGLDKLWIWPVLLALLALLLFFTLKVSKDIGGKPE